MKKIITLSLLLISFSAYALESKRVAVDTGNNLSMHKSNNINIEEISSHDTAISDRFDKYRTCIEKDMVYLGPGASNVDSDYCYNLSSTTAGSFRPRFAGLLSVGPISRSTSSSNYNSSYVGKFTLDVRCNDEYPNSHVLVYDDVKYVIDEINEDSNVTSIANYIPVFDSTKGLSYYDSSAGNYKILSKGNLVDNKLNECNSWWYTLSGGEKINSLVKTSLSGNLFYKLDIVACTQDFYIACVYN